MRIVVQVMIWGDMMIPDDMEYRNKIHAMVIDMFPGKPNERVCDITEEMYKYYKMWVRRRKEIRDTSAVAAMEIRQLRWLVSQPLFNCYTCSYSDDVIEKLSVLDSCIEDVRAALYQNNDLDNFEMELKRELRKLKIREDFCTGLP